MVTKYVMMLLSVGMLGVGMTAMAQDEGDRPAPPREAREGRPGMGPGDGLFASKELREATQKLRQLVREYNKNKDDKEKSDKLLADIKTQLTSIQDLRIKALETRVTEMKAKKDEHVTKALETIKSGEFQKQFQRGGRQGGERQSGERKGGERGRKGPKPEGGNGEF